MKTTLFLVLFTIISCLNGYCQPWYDRLDSITNSEYDELLMVGYSMARVAKDGKVGYISIKDGKVAIPLEYEWGGFFREGLAVVQKGDKCGYINPNNEVIIPFKYDWAYPFSEGFASVENEGRQGIINKKDELVVDYIYKHINEFSEGLAGFKSDNGKYGFINPKGEIIISPIYDYVDSFYKGAAIAMIYQDHKPIYGILDYSGMHLSEFIYDNIDADYRYGDKLIVKTVAGFGCINTKGEVIIPCECVGFSVGCAPSSVCLWRINAEARHDKFRIDEDGNITTD